MLKHLIHSPVYYRFYSLLKNEKSFHKCFHSRQNSLYNLRNLNFHTSSDNKSVINYNENNHAQTIVEKIQPWLIKSNTIINHEVTQEDFNEILQRNWRNAPSSEIVNAFKILQNFCVKNNINLSDERFDNLVDGVIDNCEHFSTDEIIDLLTCMVELPPCLGYSSHNFHDLWSCLDDICCWKMVDWDINTSLQVGNLWSQLHLGKIGDFTFVLLDRLVKRAETLNKNQLVTIFNFFNVCRSRAVDFEYEYALEKLVDEMNVDELAVVALGYFKTKTKIKLVSIMRTMIEKVEQSSEHIHEISLTAILKVMGYKKTKVFAKNSELELKLVLSCYKLKKQWVKETS